MRRGSFSVLCILFQIKLSPDILCVCDLFLSVICLYNIIFHVNEQLSRHLLVNSIVLVTRSSCD